MMCGKTLLIVIWLGFQVLIPASARISSDTHYATPQVSGAEASRESHNRSTNVCFSVEMCAKIFLGLPEESIF
jgi:hypothetical protein